MSFDPQHPENRNLSVLMLKLWCKSGADAAACNSSEDEVTASASYAYSLQDISLYVRILIVR